MESTVRESPTTDGCCRARSATSAAHSASSAGVIEPSIVEICAVVSVELRTSIATPPETQYTPMPAFSPKSTAYVIGRSVDDPLPTSASGVTDPRRPSTDDCRAFGDSATRVASAVPPTGPEPVIAAPAPRLSGSAGYVLIAEPPKRSADPAATKPSGSGPTIAAGMGSGRRRGPSARRTRAISEVTRMTVGHSRSS